MYIRNSVEIKDSLTKYCKVQKKLLLEVAETVGLNSTQVTSLRGISFRTCTIDDVDIIGRYYSYLVGELLKLGPTKTNLEAIQMLSIYKKRLYSLSR